MIYWLSVSYDVYGFSTTLYSLDGIVYKLFSTNFPAYWCSFAYEIREELQAYGTQHLLLKK